MIGVDGLGFDFLKGKGDAGFLMREWELAFPEEANGIISRRYSGITAFERLDLGEGIGIPLKSSLTKFHEGRFMVKEA